MNLIDPACEPAEGMEDRLDFFLSMDEWLVVEAVQVLAGIDPYLTRRSLPKDQFIFESVIQLNWHQTPAVNENGDLVCTCYDYKCAHCESAKEALLAYSQKCHEIANLLGKRYEHQTFDSPINWIERALSRGVEIPWFRWAKKRRLFFQFGSRGIALNTRQAKASEENFGCEKQSNATPDKHYALSNVKREARKLDTQAMYKSWQKAYRDLEKIHTNRNMSDVWYSQQIAKMDIAKGRNADTIRGHMKQ